jgi:ribose 5-phosphate isomerase B
MRVAVAADHAGYPLKDLVIDVVKNLGHAVQDLGTHNTDSVDYPDYALKLGRAIQQGEAERGIILCGSGVGAAVVANKMVGT